MFQQITTGSFYELADACSSQPGFALLDSRSGDPALARYSFFSFAPYANARTLSRLEQLLSQYKGDAGGAIGYFAYELGRRFEILPATAVDELGLSDCNFNLYNFTFVHDKEKDQVFLRHFDVDGGLAVDEVLRRSRCASLVASGAAGRIQADFTREAYLAALRRIREYIYAGDIYQVNMTQRFKAKLNGLHPWAIYKRLMDVNPAPFAAYLNCGDHLVACSSPERFLKLEGRKIETRPIKGTVRRGGTPQQDQANRDWLLHSEKNLAELAMIVDLLRNDIGRVCTPGTVQVKAFPEIESYASVHHLVATITGELDEDKSLIDLIQATFPGGSITGVPKIRAMEIIDELEPVTRGIYTGSIGYIGFNGIADLNIAIRTIIIKDDIAYIHAGGGITADSDEQEEYEESLLKASRLFAALK